MKFEYYFAFKNTFYFHGDMQLSSSSVYIIIKTCIEKDESKKKKNLLYKKYITDKVVVGYIANYS